ncbi:hypothetical protein E4P29_03370 [Rhodococcus sp. 1R11]|uniref:hypothetical protein n=1 Tax=Rhodococcus sp. 1R11 TaxID=2559614 RepID=UPI001072EC71|nr:hypothetical protein [Rhodococcus sp. 1R11]TFI44813.1 hypothetical protein E4P29_03370 [Rhodococcus sp. 1R11]
MSRSADSNGGQHQVPPDLFAMTADIATRYGSAVAVHRDLLAQIASTPDSTHSDQRWPVDTNPLEGPSLLDAELKIHLRHSYQDAGDLGSFPTESNPVAVRIHVQAFAATYPDRASARADLLDAVTEVESEAWTRALLGDRWADHAYELVRDEHPSERVRVRMWFKQRIYVVLLGQDGEPTLAPDNFAFPRLWHCICSARKIRPQSASLAAHIERVGPFFDTDEIRDPNTDADGGWRVEVTGVDPADLTASAGDAARHLMRRVRLRGVIDSKFRATRVHIENDTARVYFLWAKNPNTFALSLRLPQSVDDLPGPPADTPGSLVAETFANWQENLRTGLLFWGTRTRMNDGALNVSWPEGGLQHDRAYYISNVPQHDKSGVWLAEAGLNIDKAVAAQSSGHLAAWLQAYVNNAAGRPFVAHAAARWDDDTTAVVDVVDSVPNTPTSVLTKLVHAITHALANSGARTIELHYVDDAFGAFGYIEHPDSEGTMHLDVTTMP